MMGIALYSITTAELNLLVLNYLHISRSRGSGYRGRRCSYTGGLARVSTTRVSLQLPSNVFLIRSTKLYPDGSDIRSRNAQKFAMTIMENFVEGGGRVQHAQVE